MSDMKEQGMKESNGTPKKCSYIQYATANYNEISKSQFSYCIYCYGLSQSKSDDLIIIDSKIYIHDMDWINDKTGETALCKKCSVDAIIPGNYFNDKDGEQLDDEVIIEQLAKWYDEGFVIH